MTSNAGLSVALKVTKSMAFNGICSNMIFKSFISIAWTNDSYLDFFPIHYIVLSLYT